MYLINFTELQYSTFMCALYVFDSNGEYGTIHRLSTSISLFRLFMLATLPPSSADRLLYNGYPSCPVSVLASNARGYRFEHFPSFMHCACGFIDPHGPCIIVVVTMSYKSLSPSASGISAHITSSMWSEVILLCSHSSMCACGNPHFCHSTEYIQQHTAPNTSCFTMNSISDFSFCLNTRAVMSCLSTGDWPGSNSCCISAHAGLHVNVTNRSGRP
jgi:hypothetical protein